MSGRYDVLNPKTFDTESLAREAFALDVLMGLSGEPKSLPSKYFYDDAGSELFARITECEDYYPTRCEAEILERRGAELAAALPRRRFRLIELGAGDGRKTMLLIDALRRAGHDFSYVPIDISEAAMRAVTDAAAERFPGLQCRGVVAEYFDALKWVNRQDGGPKLALFLGSNIGNFNGPRARVFLRTLWNALNAGDHLLIGFDLKKDIDVLLAAYNDREGLTERFNLNLLSRINRELGADFDPARFQHFGTYSVRRGAMESYLLSREAQSVRVEALGKRFDFKPFEPVHIEDSFKYLPEEAVLLGAETGFAPALVLADERRWFLDALWRVEKR